MRMNNASPPASPQARESVLPILKSPAYAVFRMRAVVVRERPWRRRSRAGSCPHCAGAAAGRRSSTSRGRPPTRPCLRAAAGPSPGGLQRPLPVPPGAGCGTLFPLTGRQDQKNGVGQSRRRRSGYCVNEGKYYPTFPTGVAIGPPWAGVRHGMGNLIRFLFCAHFLSV